MDKLPPELLLKIARYCDFAEVCALSKVNRRWNEVIESNCDSLQTTLVVCLEMDEFKDGSKIECEILTKDGRKKWLNLNISKGSEIVNAGELFEEYWSDVQHGPYKNYIKPADTEKFIGNLLTPIFRSSAFRNIYLIAPKSSTLQLLIALLERFRPTIKDLHMSLGREGMHWKYAETNVKELNDAARIVELSKLYELSFEIGDSFTKKEFREHLLKKIANLYIPCVSMALTLSSEADSSYGYGPIPNCRSLECLGSINHISALDVLNIVDVVEEWSNNKRDIVHYMLKYFVERMEDIAAQFEHALKERNLPIQIEVVKKNEEFLFKKIATRGDKQDEIRMVFERRRRKHDGVFFDTIIIRTNEDDRALSVLIFGNDRFDYAELRKLHLA